VGEQRVRIIAGRWKGRRLAAPAGVETRPTADRVREAVFSSLCSFLGADLGGANVLDAFAGSGALGLEALSRGASRATFLECDGAARRMLQGNVEGLGASAVATVSGADVFSAAAAGRVPGAPFGLLFVDPPYRIDSARVAQLLVDMTAMGALEGAATVVWEHSSACPAAWPETFDERTTRRYGTSQVSIAAYRGGFQRT
jgi:16S rRNA (guanine966-N2)-methyltransferase